MTDTRDERRVVTSLFADVVGSTALAEQLEAEDFRLIVSGALDRMAQAVERYGGTVKDLAGDGLLALFGAPQVHEDDAERALRAALDLQSAIAGYVREVEEGWNISGLAVRVGVSTGPVVVGPVEAGAVSDYTAYGDAVNTAARLQGASDPGGIIVDEATRRLAGEAFAFGPRAEVDVKGKADPVATYALAGYSGTDSDRAADELKSPTVGRDAELLQLKEVTKSLAQGTGRVLFINGEPGIGKSRLLEELRGLAQSQASPLGPLTWLEGQAASFADAVPYWPFRDLLRRWLGVSLNDPELKVRVALRRELQRLFAGRVLEIYPYLGSMLSLALEPDAADKLAALSPEALQFRTFEVWLELIERLSTDGPIVMAVEDLHWSDSTSGQLLERAISLTESAPILVVLTSRLDPDHHSWQLRDRASREYPHTTSEITLGALPGDSDRTLLDSLIGDDVLPAAIEEQVLATAEGNPFFVEELIGSLADAGALFRTEDGWTYNEAPELEVPPTIERVLLARIDRLDPDDHEVLIGAAVIGRTFTSSLLRAASGRTDQVVSDSLHALQRLDLVRIGRRWPQPEYQFKHALIQETAYRTVLKEDLVRRHSAVAEYLEAEFTDNLEEAYGLLAHHWAAAGKADKAIHYLTLAGDKARNEYALDEAVDYYQQLLPLLEALQERHEAALILFKIALALHMSLRFGEANGTYQRAFEYWDGREAWEGEVDRTLRMASLAVTDPDPPHTSWLGNIKAGMALFDRLVEALPDRSMIPSLAERWTISDDGLRYEFILREGLLWSDGRPITAGDVEYGVKRMLNRERPGFSVAIYFVLENAQSYYLEEHDDLDSVGVRALDDRTVEFRLAAPAPYFMWVLNRPEAGPQPRHAIEAHGDEWLTPKNQVVSGPFRMVEYANDGLVLERRGEYTAPRGGNVRRIEWSAPSDEDVDLYRRGQVDLFNTRFRDDESLALELPDQRYSWPPTYVGYLIFDHSHPVTGDRDFRAALAHSVDREGLQELLPSNYAVATGGLVPPPLQGHTPDIALPFDPEEGRRLLAQAGVDATGLSLPVLAGDDQVPLLEFVLDGWRTHLGLEIDPEEIPFDVLYSGEPPWRKYHLDVGGWIPGYPDPEYYLRLLLHSESATNEGGFADEEYDALVEAARQERSDRERLELFHAADRLAVVDRVGVIPLWYGRNVTYIKPDVKGWWEFGKAWANLAEVVIEEG